MVFVITLILIITIGSTPLSNTKNDIGVTTIYLFFTLIL